MYHDCLNKWWSCVNMAALWCRVEEIQDATNEADYKTYYEAPKCTLQIKNIKKVFMWIKLDSTLRMDMMYRTSTLQRFNHFFLYLPILQ